MYKCRSPRNVSNIHHHTFARKPSNTIMGLLDLPPELTQAIAKYLTLPAAHALAKAAAVLEPAADSRIYRDITISHADQFAPTHNLSPDTIESRGPPTHSHTGGETILKSLGSKTVLQAHLDLIRAKPWRAAQVRKLDVQLGQTIPDELDKLLSLVSPGLIDLRLAYPAARHLALPGHQVQSLSQVLETPGRSFPALWRADIQVGTHWSRCLTLMLKTAPRLKRLRVKGDEVPSVSNPGDGDGNKTEGFTPSATVPQHLELEVLHVSPVVPAIVPLLADIVRSSPNLQHAAFASPWCPGPGDPLIAALASAPELQRLEIPSSCLRRIRDQGGFGKINNLTLSWSLLDLKAAADDSASSGLGCVAIVPEMPELETCLFNFTTYEPGVPSYDVFRGRMFDLSIQAIRAHALRTSFASTPLLRSIDLGDMYGMKNMGHAVGHDYSGPPTSQISGVDPYFDGALITRFFDGPDSLIYIKHRSAFSCGWEQYAVYNGKQMPIGKLASVTDANGVRLNKTKPGVGTLSKEGWDVLRHWTAEL